MKENVSCTCTNPRQTSRWGVMLAAAALAVLAGFAAPATWAQIDPPATCDDGNPCTVDVADPNVIDGGCRHTPKDCNDGDACTTDTCNPTTGVCEHTGGGGGGGDTGCGCDDGNPCTIDSGTPGGDGGCQHTPKDCNDGDACTTDTCNTETGACEHTGGGGGGGDTGCTCDDGDPCTVDTGTPGGDGGCQHTPKDCDDDNPCTVDTCEGGSCVNEPVGGGGDASCDLAICRTPGFYGTHAGTEKTGSVNITQALINAAGGSLSICGETISTTIVNDDASALEGICVPVQGAQQLQLARQLIAAALNCVISDGDESCASTPLFASVFATCNATCANPASSSTALGNCINQIDCLNNGGVNNGFCQTGTCTNGSACGPKNACSDGSVCKALDGNCHKELLVNEDLGLSFTKEGPAGSSKACNTANGTGCVVVGVNQSKCKF